MSLVAEDTPGASPVTVTHLVHSGPPTNVRPAPAGAHVDLVVEGQAEFSAMMYAQVGAPWTWVDRLEWLPEQWQEWVKSPGFRQLRLMHDDAVAGYAELITPVPGTVQIAYFGLLPQQVGKGLGSWWLEYVLAYAWDHDAVNRVTVQTCDLDHPSALPNYVARGFVPDHTEREWRLIDE